MSNRDVARLLREVASAYAIKDEKKFRFQIIAYQRAADSIEHATSEVKDLWEDGELDELPGIGPSIKDHLEKLFKTGRVKHFDWVKKGIPEAVFPLLDIPTFGPKKAFSLITALKIKKAEGVVEKLEQYARKGKIGKIPGFGEKSEQDILRAIKEYKQGKVKTARMVLPYAFEVASKVLSYLRKSPLVERAEPLGSLRRMVATIGDIDIAVASGKNREVIEYFVKYPQTERVIEKGDATASILTSGGRQIDLMIQPPQSFGSLLQHFTGSKSHNIKLRELALKKGLSLSEYGIKRVAAGKTVLDRFPEEKAFYKALGMVWIPPELREDTGELEVALAGKLPNLVELKDIKGDFHIHSNFPIEPSHDLGRSSMEEMLKKARDLGYEYLGFSEHNPSINKHSKEAIYTILSKRKKYIEHLKSSNKDIRIINLLEIDILADGNLAVGDEGLQLLDAAIVSIHSSFDQSRGKMTERVLRGLRHPKAKILAHPTGRLLQTREGFELDWEKVFDFCKKHRKALEINAFPLRLDLTDVLVREAVRHGVRLVIDTDSHEVSQMDLMKYGVSVARRGWAEKSDIINTLPYKEFVAWL